MKNNRLCSGKLRSIWTNNPEDHNYLEAREDPHGFDHPIKRKRLTCPACGRRLLSSIEMCDDGCCLIHRLPPHKPKGYKKPRTLKAWGKAHRRKSR